MPTGRGEGSETAVLPCRLGGVGLATAVSSRLFLPREPPAPLPSLWKRS